MEGADSLLCDFFSTLPLVCFLHGLPVGKGLFPLHQFAAIPVTTGSSCNASCTVCLPSNAELALGLVSILLRGKFSATIYIY